jgi:tetratricopeptide (TPR) repeat protein
MQAKLVALMVAGAVWAGLAHANAPAVAATAPPGAAAERTYTSPGDALIAADIDYLVNEARRAFDAGDHSPARATIVFLDEMAAGRTAKAREVLDAIPQEARLSSSALFEPFLLAAEGRMPAALEEAQAASAGGGLPAPLADLMRALVLEGGGQLAEAAAAYADVEAALDTRPPPENEPQNAEDFQRLLGATRTTHALYRAALLQHRLGHREEARRLYDLVAQFAPHSADVGDNLARLARRRPPAEPALDAKRALGRWLTFLSDFMNQTEGLAATLATGGQVEGLASPTSAMFLQFALALDPSADDWRLAAAAQLLSAYGYDGAERVLAPIRRGALFAPEADLMRAGIALARNNDERAAGLARAAAAAGDERLSVLTSAGDVLRTVGRAAEARAMFDRALDIAIGPKEQSDVLRLRAFAQRFAGDVPAAVSDMRRALALDQRDNTRIMFVAILMDDPEACSDGIREARALFLESPNSVSRLNTLGYALIQKPEGLEEGYRLLWRGYILGETNYAVVDSLGWAYYLHGAFDEARALIERADELAGEARNAEVLDHLGDVYWRLAMPTDARAKWTDALAARPDALREQALRAKLADGLTTPAPERRALPNVEAPTIQRDET